MIWTDVALVAALVLLLVVEAVSLASTREDDMITTRIRKWSRATHLIPFLAGLLCGHFWWCSCL